MAVRSSNDIINEITIPEQLPSKCSDEDSESSLSDGLNTVHVEANNIFSDISDAPDDYDTASLSDELIQYNAVSSTHIIKPVCKAIQQVFHCIHAVEYTINHDASCIYTARSILPHYPIAGSVIVMISYIDYSNLSSIQIYSRIYLRIMTVNIYAVYLKPWWK
jgi:hypothetical protein